MGFLKILKTILYPERESTNAAIRMKFMPAWMRPLWLNAATTNQHLQQLKLVKKEVDREGGEEDIPEGENELPDEENDRERGQRGDETELGCDEETETETETKPKKKDTDRRLKKGSGSKEKDSQILLEIKIRDDHRFAYSPEFIDSKIHN